MTKEALKLALDALEDLGMKHYEITGEVLYKETFTAIKEALAQPEQEPVAYWNFNSGFSHCMIDQLNEAAKKNPAPLYTTPPQRKPLTDEQARFEFEAWHKDAYTQSLERYGHTYKNHHTRCRWQGWLAAHGIKGEA